MTNNELETLRQQTREHGERVTAEIRQWPQWKQNLLREYGCEPLYDVGETPRLTGDEIRSEYQRLCEDYNANLRQLQARCDHANPKRRERRTTAGVDYFCSDCDEYITTILFRDEPQQRSTPAQIRSEIAKIQRRCSHQNTQPFASDDMICDDCGQVFQ